MNFALLRLFKRQQYEVLRRFFERNKNRLTKDQLKKHLSRYFLDGESVGHLIEKLLNFGLIAYDWRDVFYNVELDRRPHENQ